MITPTDHALALSEIRAICADAERRFEATQSVVERIDIYQSAIRACKEIAAGQQ